MGRTGEIRRRILALSGIVPWLVSLPAHAEPWNFGPFDVVGAGVFVGYTFGEERGVDWGLEGFATRYFTTSVQPGTDRSGFGPLLRLGMLDASRFAFTGAGHIGTELACSSVAGDVELGGTLALASGGMTGSVHTGLTLESIIFNAYARQEWALQSYSVGLGARVLPTFGQLRFCGQGGAVDGRAFRDDSGHGQSRAVRALSPFDRHCPDAARWAARSRDECSSILAFLQLAVELLDEAAPLELVARAVRCAEQELSHTWGAAGLASRFGGARLFPSSPAPRFRPRLPRRQQLARLLHEGWVDGCLNEGLAALVAAEEARVSTDYEEARLSAKIAREETEHAALALDVVRWVLAQDTSLAPNHPQQPQELTSVSSLLGPRRVRELAHDHTTTARKHLVA